MYTTINIKYIALLLILYGTKSSIACGTNTEELSGVIYTPDFPLEYKENLECVWRITVPPSRTITLEFQFFEMEDDECQYDYVVIMDDATLIRKICGSNLPPSITTNSNKMTILFSSDEVSYERGFIAIYTSTDKITGLKSEPPDYHNIVGCGRTFTNEGGILQSPNYPNNYPNYALCIWSVRVPDDNEVTLSFTEFELEETSSFGCDYDYVEMFEDDHKVFRICGTSHPAPIKRTGKTLKIIFTSDSSDTFSGFSASLVMLNKNSETTTNVNLVTTKKQAANNDDDDTNDMVTLMLIIFGALFGFIVMVVCGILIFFKIQKNKILEMKKSKRKTRPKRPVVKDLPALPSFKNLPRANNQTHHPPPSVTSGIKSSMEVGWTLADVENPTLNPKY